jgi:LytS/YehU family sensor histidine kinase
VEQVRLGSRLQVTWEWPEALNERRLPPLLIQPLVENAVKHGLSLEEEGGLISISLAVIEGDLLRIVIANTGRPLDPEPREGTGLSNLSDRLALIGSGSSLDLRREGPMTVADLRVFSRGTT